MLVLVILGVGWLPLLIGLIYSVGKDHKQYDEIIQSSTSQVIFEVVI